MAINRRRLFVGASASAVAATGMQFLAGKPAPATALAPRPRSGQSGLTESPFADTYQTARGKFLAAAQAAKAQIEHHRLPGFDDLDDKPLYMDTAWLGAHDADVVVVSISGNHGAEGFCGSAAQVDWLTHEARGSALPKGVAALLVHAVNPYGFAYLLRTNENNVNINRNSIDFKNPPPANPLFREVYATLPTRIGYDEELIVEFDEKIAEAKSKYGAWEVNNALGRGQYENSDAMEYGGTRTAWSSQTLFDLLKRTCARARHIAYIDWHTLINIGDGKLVYLCFNQTDDHLYDRAGTWWTREAIDRETVNKQWSDGTTVRRPSRSGILMWGVQNALAPRADVAGAVIEFCADPDTYMFSPKIGERGWMYARWLRHTRDYTSPAGRQIAAYLRESTSPTRRSFQHAALNAARDVYRRTFAGAARWAEENIAADPGRLVHYSNFE